MALKWFGAGRREPARVAKALVHKSKRMDVVISTPIPVDGKSGTFRSEIVDPPKSHFLSHPPTWRIREAMLMIEAAQQVAKAALKLYCGDPRKGILFTGIEEFKVGKELLRSERGFVEVTFGKKRLVDLKRRERKFITPDTHALQKPVDKMDYLKVSIRVLNEKGEVCAFGKGNCTLFDMNTHAF